MQQTEEFFRFYREKMLYLQAQPNQAHLQLAKWEREGKNKGVDYAEHRRAAPSGRCHVVELHGSVLRNHCMQCGKAYTAEEMAQSRGVPRCVCGGVIKPDVVLYEESLNGADIEEAVRLIENAEVLIVGGTSLASVPGGGADRLLQRGSAGAHQPRRNAIRQEGKPADSGEDRLGTGANRRIKSARFGRFCMDLLSLKLAQAALADALRPRFAEKGKRIAGQKHKIAVWGIRVSRPRSTLVMRQSLGQCTWAMRFWLTKLP